MDVAWLGKYRCHRITEAGDTRPMHVEIIKRPAATANVAAALRLSINIDAARYGWYYGRVLPGFRPAFPTIFPEFSR